MKVFINKIIIFLTLSSLLLISCKKDEDENRSSGGGNNTASIAQYVANWKLARYETVLNIGPPTGLLNSTQNFNNPNTCILFLTANPSLTPNYYQASFSYGACTPVSVAWNVTTPGYLEIQLQQFFVEKLTNDSLVLTTGDISVGSQKVYYRYIK